MRNLADLKADENIKLSTHEKALRINLDPDALRHVCRNRRGAGSGALVLQGRRGGRLHFQVHVRL